MGGGGGEVGEWGVGGCTADGMEQSYVIARDVIARDCCPPQLSARCVHLRRWAGRQGASERHPPGALPLQRAVKSRAAPLLRGRSLVRVHRGDGCALCGGEARELYQLQPIKQHAKKHMSRWGSRRHPEFRHPQGPHQLQLSPASSNPVDMQRAQAAACLPRARLLGEAACLQRP